MKQSDNELQTAKYNPARAASFGVAKSGLEK